MNPDAIDLIKSGELYISINLRRDKGGVKLHFKAHPAVEELAKSWGNGERVPISQIGGRNWVSEKTLYAWQGNNLGLYGIDDKHSYFLHAPGGVMKEILPSSTIPGKRITAVNFGFMRLAGISDDSGVSFLLAQVMTVEGLVELRDLLQLACRKFYADFLKPIDLSVSLIGDNRPPQMQISNIPVEPVRNLDEALRIARGARAQANGLRAILEGAALNVAGDRLDVEEEEDDFEDAAGEIDPNF